MVGKRKEEVKVVTSGAGAAAVSIVKLLLSAGYRNIIMTDRNGAIVEKGIEGETREYNGTDYTYTGIATWRPWSTTTTPWITTSP